VLALVTRRVRTINAGEEVVIPSDVQVEVKAREVKVTGKRGTLERSFKHASIEMKKCKNAKGEDVVKVRSQPQP
jgi:ribosomal protein L6P/L9E